MKSKNQDSDTLGAEESTLPNSEQITEWLSRDLDACIALLTAIRQDTDLKLTMARWFEGRIQNYKNKPDPSQVAMEFGSKKANN